MITVTFWNKDNCYLSGIQNNGSYENMLRFEKLHGSVSTKLELGNDLMDAVRQINNIVEVCLQETNVNLSYVIKRSIA